MNSPSSNLSHAINSFHRSALTLIQCGIPLDIDCRSQAAAAGQLEVLRSQLPMEPGTDDERGLNEWLSRVADCQQLPASYRGALVAWVKCGPCTAAMDSLVLPARWNQRAIAARRQALVKPFVLAVLGIAALFYLSQFTFVSFQRLESQLGRSSWLIGQLSWLSEYWYWWLPVAGITLAVLAFRWRLDGRHARAPLMTSGMRSASTMATFCRRLAALHEHADELQAVQWAVSPDAMASKSAQRALSTATLSTATLSTATLSTATASPNEGEGADSHAYLQQSRLESTQSRLHFFGNAHERIAALRCRRFTGWLIPVMASLLGGIVVAILAACVFLPLLELMYFVIEGGSS